MRRAARTRTWQGNVFNHDGEQIAPPADLTKWRTDELLPLRCPHPPTAARMATLIRQVKQTGLDRRHRRVQVHKVPAGLGEPVFDRLEVARPPAARRSATPPMNPPDRRAAVFAADRSRLSRR